MVVALEVHNYLSLAFDGIGPECNVLFRGCKV
jgi:hypothetical protein